MTAQHSHSFSDDEQTSIAAIVAQIILASIEFTQLGADDSEILNDILTSGAALQDKLGRALVTLVDKAEDVGQTTIFRKSFPVEAEMLQTLTVQCYYRNARVMQALNIDVRTPHFRMDRFKSPTIFLCLSRFTCAAKFIAKSPSLMGNRFPNQKRKPRKHENLCAAADIYGHIHPLPRRGIPRCRAQSGHTVG